MGARLRALAVADEPEAWRDAGFAVEGGCCRLGDVDVVLGAEGGRGVRAWAVDGVDGPVDGLAPFVAAPPEGEGPAHPNGTVAIDHLVVATPDLDRTVDALCAAGLEPRRTREGTAMGSAVRQVFFRFDAAGADGPPWDAPILEVVGPPEAAGDGPARFFGLALTVADLDATAAHLGEHLGSARPAVQPGRRIATLRSSAGCTTALAFLSPSSR
jgi:hypothetical protein